MEYVFDHEKLRVYQEAIQFVTWSDEVIRSIEGNGPLKDQLNGAAMSIPLNIAEGNGKSSPRDRARFFEIARGSAFECAACIDVIVAKGLLKSSELQDGKKMLHGIISMLMGLARASKVGSREGETEYKSIADRGSCVTGD